VVQVYGRHATRSGTVPPGGVTGLEWSGNETTELERRLQWTSPFAIYDATYIFKAFPKGPKLGTNPRYWTMFFWGNNGTFAWDAGQPNTYYGAHPYPFDGADQATGQNWELSTFSNDFSFVTPNAGAEVDPWDTWYTQVFRAWRESASITHHEFYWDWPDEAKLIEHTIDLAQWADTNPPSPAIVVGQAPNNGLDQSWGGYAGFEEYEGILRGFQFYNSLLTPGQVASELATPGSVVTPWYLNLNPTVADVTDKSGSGNHPSWGGSDRPADWAA